MRTVSEPGAVLPNSLEVVDMDGKVVQTMSNACPGYHGFAIADEYEMLGCEAANAGNGGGHILAIRFDKSTNQHHMVKLTYPDTDQRSGTLHAVPGTSFAIGNYFRGVVRADPTVGSIDAARDVLSFPAESWPADDTRGRVCSWAVQKGGSAQVVAALPDGYLYLYNSSDFSINPRRLDIFSELRSTLVRANYSCAGAQSVKVEVGTRMAFVSRPGISEASILQVDLELATVTELTVPESLAGKVADMLMVEPAAAVGTDANSDECAEAHSAARSAASSDTAASSGASSGDDNSDHSTIVGLTVAMGLIAILLIIVAVLLLLALRKQAAKVQFSNPYFERGLGSSIGNLSHTGSTGSMNSASSRQYMNPVYDKEAEAQMMHV